MPQRVLRAVAETRQPARLAIRPGHERIRHLRLFPFQCRQELGYGVRQQHGVVIQDQQVGEGLVFQFPCSRFRQAQSAAAARIRSRGHVVCAAGRLLDERSNFRIARIVTHHDCLDSRQRSQQARQFARPAIGGDHGDDAHSQRRS
jgi:hypothetical protein